MSHPLMAEIYQGPANKNNNPFQHIVLIYVTETPRERPWIGKDVAQRSKNVSVENSNMDKLGGAQACHESAQEA